jgi:hypothetical protein
VAIANVPHRAMSHVASIAVGLRGQPLTQLLSSCTTPTPTNWAPCRHASAPARGRQRPVRVPRDLPQPSQTPQRTGQAHTHRMRETPHHRDRVNPERLQDDSAEPGAHQPGWPYTGSKTPAIPTRCSRAGGTTRSNTDLPATQAAIVHRRSSAPAFRSRRCATTSRTYWSTISGYCTPTGSTGTPRCLRTLAISAGHRVQPDLAGQGLSPLRHLDTVRSRAARRHADKSRRRDHPQRSVRASEVSPSGRPLPEVVARSTVVLEA